MLGRWTFLSVLWCALAAAGVCAAVGRVACAATNGLASDVYGGNGNTRYLTATNATISDTYVYDAFGTLLASTGSTPNDYLFTGEQRDATLGLYYLRARYLNSGTGRFWSRDTVGVSKRDPRTLHRYLYCANQPIDFIDPSGHDLNKLLPPSFQKIAKRAGIYAAVAIYVGMKAHEKIGQEYLKDHGYQQGIFINSSIASVLELAPDFDTDINRKLRPDIADGRPGVNEVYEIKSGWIRALGDAVDSARHQADNYISVLSEATGAKPPGGAAVWRAGTSWNPEGIYSLDTLVPLRIVVSRPEPGVIIYEPTSEFYVYVLAGEIVPKAARAVAAYSRARMQQEIAAAPIFSLGLGF